MPAPNPPSDGRPIVTSISGGGRDSAHTEIRQRLTLTMTYRLDRPYEVGIRIAQRGREDEGAHWQVSREVLHNAVIWHTPTVLGDFQVVPMARGVIQLVFTSVNPHSREPESIYVDVQAEELAGFMARTVRAVKPGDESGHVDMDLVVSELLSSDSR